jgi:hypothetical protein
MRGLYSAKHDIMRGKRTQLLLKDNKQSTVMQIEQNITVIQ